MHDQPDPIPVELIGPEPVAWIPAREPVFPIEPRSTRSLIVAIGLFVITAFSTLAAGTQFAAAYAANESPGFDHFFSDYFRPFIEPRLFLAGIPFAATLLGILLAHELGHFFACRHYRISATYPFFIPAPTLIGTLGAFIRIRSPIFNRRALFDMALAGPLVGFLIAVPALAIAILFSKVIPASDASRVRFRPAPHRTDLRIVPSSRCAARISFAASGGPGRVGRAVCNGAQPASGRAVGWRTHSLRGGQ